MAGFHSAAFGFLGISWWLPPAKKVVSQVTMSHFVQDYLFVSGLATLMLEVGPLAALGLPERHLNVKAPHLWSLTSSFLSPLLKRGANLALATSRRWFEGRSGGQCKPPAFERETSCAGLWCGQDWITPLLTRFNRRSFLILQACNQSIDGILCFEASHLHPMEL